MVEWHPNERRMRRRKGWVEREWLLKLKPRMRMRLENSTKPLVLLEEPFLTSPVVDGGVEEREK